MLATGTRILVCTEPQDMRRSFDRLAQVARDILGEEPLESGALYVFVSKSATRVKVLWWDKNGYCLLYKRLHHALFRLPRDAPKVGAAMQIDERALAELLRGVEKESTEKARALH
jgi:transposase